MSIKNERFKDSQLVTAFGVIEFDAEGVSKTKLEQDAIEALSQLKGFEKVTIKEAPKAAKAPVKEAEETVETEEKEPEPEKKTAPAKTAKKTAK